MMGNIMSPSPACDSELTQLMGTSAAMTLFIRLLTRWFVLQAQRGIAQARAVLCRPEFLVHQSTNYIRHERIPLILLEVTLWKIPQYITVSGSYISTTKFKFCQHCSY